MGSKIVAPENPDGIPEYLKQRPQWIVWGKRTKLFQNALLDNGKLVVDKTLMSCPLTTNQPSDEVIYGQ
jgi:hypothetical protein